MSDKTFIRGFIYCSDDYADQPEGAEIDSAEIQNIWEKYSPLFADNPFLWLLRTSNVPYVRLLDENASTFQTTWRCEGLKIFRNGEIFVIYVPLSGDDSLEVCVREGGDV